MSTPGANIKHSIFSLVFITFVYIGVLFVMDMRKNIFNICVEEIRLKQHRNVWPEGGKKWPAYLVTDKKLGFIQALTS